MQENLKKQLKRCSMKIIDFDLELAKKITSGEIDGEIVYERKDLPSYRNARIISFDFKHFNGARRGIALITTLADAEYAITFDLDPKYAGVIDKDSKLKLRVPDIYSYKKGDILTTDGGPFIFDRYDSKKDEVYSLAGLRIDGSFIGKSDNWCFTERIRGKANQAQKDRLMKAMEENGYRWDAENLELVEVKEFKPFDRVIGVISCGAPIYQADLFSHIESGGAYACIGGTYERVYPFEGNEHLLEKNDEKV